MHDHDAQVHDVRREKECHGDAAQRFGDRDRVRPWESTCGTTRGPRRSGARPNGSARDHGSAWSARSAAAAEREHHEEDERAKPPKWYRRLWTGRYLMDSEHTVFILTRLN